MGCRGGAGRASFRVMGRGGQGEASGTEKEDKVDPKLALGRDVFLLRTPAAADAAGRAAPGLKQGVLDALRAAEAAPLYAALCEEFGWPVDAALLADLKAKNAAALAAFDEKVADADENLGESEVREALQAKAEYLVQIGDKDAVGPAFEATEKKTVAVGLKMDQVFVMMREGFFYNDLKAVKACIRKLKDLLATPGGADWERKNRLKVYEALYCMVTRDFKGAATLFLESLSTFTTYELFPYSQFVFYTVVTSMVALDRVTLKEKVIDSPEILTVIEEVPNLVPLINGLYECDYTRFFDAFAKLCEQVRADPYLHAHHRYFMREIRVVAYSQFLESYKSVTLENMAVAFGVSSEFLDKELSLFIAAGRLNCKIDKVQGVLETNRPDTKNALYQSMIKQGDALLNRVQKLSRVIDL